MVLFSTLYPARLPWASELAPHFTVMVLPPEMLLGIVMLLGVVGAVFVVMEPSSETKSVEGNIKAGRTPRERLAHQLLQLPSEYTYHTLLAS